MAKSINPPVLSFFTGGGFLDAGFEKAGFKIVWTNEFNPTFVRMYELGYSSWRKSESPESPDAKISNTQSINDLKPRSILYSTFGRKKPKIFGIIGGPPCPDFSNGGKNNGHKGVNGKLTKVFIDTIIAIRPTFFVIENVPGLFRTLKHREFLDKMTKQLRDKGYLVDRVLLNALEFGVPQDRERLFIFGINRKYYTSKYSNIISDDDGWFPWPEKKYPDVKHKYKWPTQNTFLSTPEKPEGIPTELMVNQCLVGAEAIANGSDCYRPKSLKFQIRDEGDTSRMSFKRLHRNRFSPTMCFGNNEVHLHPWLPRRLSVRETMRIQSIPDSYELPSDASLEAKFKIVGNGVPFLLGKHVAEAVLKFLNQGK